MQYTFLKSETTSEIVIIILAQPQWVKSNINITYDNQKMTLKVSDEIFYTDELPEHILNSLNNHITQVYFTNEDGKIIAKSNIGFFS